MHLKEIIIYPVKSLSGISLKKTEVDSRGLKYDRRFALVDKNNKFISKRTHPVLAKFKVSIQGKFLEIEFENEKITTLLEINEADYSLENITVWDSTIKSYHKSKQIDTWFSKCIGEPVRLFFQGKDSNRLIDSKFQVKTTDQTSFADGYPVLIISEKSLSFLNDKLNKEVEMNRFRPNLIIEGGEPFVEDDLRNINIGTASFACVKPSARCIMVNLNNQTQLYEKEPLNALSEFRKIGSKVYFGMNALIHKPGQLEIGNEIVEF